MKRYAVFDYEGYYPGGGWNDFTGAFDTLEEAIAAAGEQVVDLQTGKVVWGDGAEQVTIEAARESYAEFGITPQVFTPDPDAVVKFFGHAIELDERCPRNSITLVNIGDFR